MSRLLRLWKDWQVPGVAFPLDESKVPGQGSGHLDFPCSVLHVDEMIPQSLMGTSWSEIYHGLVV